MWTFPNLCKILVVLCNFAALLIDWSLFILLSQVNDSGAFIYRPKNDSI